MTRGTQRTARHNPAGWRPERFALAIFTDFRCLPEGRYTNQCGDAHALFCALRNPYKVYQHSRHEGSFRAGTSSQLLFALPGTLSAFPAAGLALSVDQITWGKAQQNGNQASEFGNFREFGISI